MNALTSKALLKKLKTHQREENILQKGFTLVELMVVIVIVGILSAVALPQLNAAQDRAKDSVARQEAISAAKECSIYLLGGEIGDEPDGAQFDTVTVTEGCEEVVATSESTDTPTFTVTLEDGVPGLPADSRDQV
jgi:type IV pilus assembly protein PilA